ncbi:MAG: ABC transporter ATP-binding protein [Vicinamibacteria bacterium]|nr:ABC transporter ATP-binding protein [Vicinamibacteria bacterium]
MRGAIRLVGVGKSFGGTEAVREVSLDVAPGEFVTLLGPSGCGKTTLLRLLAGFETPDAGQVLISGRDVAGLPPHRRPVNTVFQHYALFPHQDVAGNVAFGLRMQKRPAAEIRDKVARALDLVQLAGYEARRVDELSGGQKQRVALARALVLEPEVLLLDEPLAALDAKLRAQMQVELKNLQERLQMTFVFVTHDRDEALIMSDRVAVMNAGRVEQEGAPDALYDRPRTRFVADFLGVRNLLHVRVLRIDEGLAQLEAGRLRFAARDDGGYRAGAETWVGVRPERVRLLAEGASEAGAEDGVVEDEIYLGDRTDWVVRAAGHALVVAESARGAQPRGRGERVRLLLPPEAVLRLADGDGV